MSATWRIATVFLVLGLTALACFLPLVLHPGELLVGAQRGGQNDLTAYFLASREFPRRCWEMFGQMPFWNPYLAGGMPHAGNPQSALWYPLNLPIWLLGADKLVSWQLVLHHAIGGLGAFLLARRLGLTRSGALLTGVAYLGAPILMARTCEGHLTFVAVEAWAPWAFWAWERLRADHRRGGGLVLVLATCILAGHTQATFYLCLALAALGVAELIRRFRAGEHPAARALATNAAIIGLFTLGIAMVEILPLFVYIKNSARGMGALSGGSTLSSSGPANLLQLLYPFIHGTPATYRGPGMYYWETLISLGVLPLLLASLGLVAAFRSRRNFLGLAIIGLGSVLFAMGGNTPFYTVLEKLPGVGMFRYPSRALFLFALVGAVLAGLGLDTLRELAAAPGDRWRTLWRRSLPPIIVTILVIIVASAPGLRGGLPAAFSVLKSLEMRMAIAALAIAVGLAMSRAVPSSLPAALLILATLVELALISNSILRTRPLDSFRAANPVLAELKSQDSFNDGRTLARYLVITDREAESAAIPKVLGYEPVPPARFLLYLSKTKLHANAMAGLFGVEPLDLTQVNPLLLDLMSVRQGVFLKSDKGVEALGWKLRAVGRVDEPMTDPTAPEPRSFEYQIQENPRALPRAYVVGSAKVHRLSDPVENVLAGFNPREQVLLERDALPDSSPRQPFTPARITRDTPNLVAVEVETSQPGYLVLTDNWFPGWSATIDGKEAPVLAANLGFRAIALPQAGKHSVVFTYEPVGWLMGLLISVLTAGLLAYATLAQMAAADQELDQDEEGDLDDAPQLIEGTASA